MSKTVYATLENGELRQWLMSKRPMNWDEMRQQAAARQAISSSAKGLWEECMRRSWERGYR